MCVANLNVTLQPCSHRWYKLVRSCSVDTDLATCPQRLKLEGWETKNEECPWCSPSNSPTSDIDEATHKLFGGRNGSIDRRKSDSSTISSTSPSRSQDRRGSSPVASISGSRSSSLDGDEEAREMERAERQRMINRRIEAYMVMNPTKVFTDGPDTELPRVDESPSNTISISRNGSVISKGWKRGMKMSKGMFK